MTVKDNISQIAIGLVCLLGFISLLLYLYPDRNELNIKGGVGTSIKFERDTVRVYDTVFKITIEIIK